MSGARVSEETARLIPGRSCDSCTMCCKLFDIGELDKKQNVWCRHCEVGRGCRIYDTRPQGCRDFFCHYRLDADCPEHWKPSKTHMVIVSTADPTWIAVHVDPARPNAWREGRYYRDLKAWSANRIKADKFIHVHIGARIVVVLPDRDVDLGEMGDRVIATKKTWTSQGPRYEFEAVERNDPRIAGVQPR